MRCFYVSGLVALALLAAPARAVDVAPVSSGMGEESLVPLAVVSATRVEASATVAAAPAASDTAAASDPFTAQRVEVSLEGTSGFDRDAALEKAARQSLPAVLVNMGMPADKAEAAVKNLGSVMRFVKGYKVVKESLIPHYQLTADITFHEPMLVKNFGSALPPKQAEPAPVAGETSAATPQALPTHSWLVVIAETNPASVDKVRTNLNALDATTATYRLLTSDTAELVVQTPLDQNAIQAAVGPHVRVISPAPVETPVTDGPVAASSVPATNPVVQPGLRPWQGHDDRSEPAAEDAQPSRPWFPWGR